MITTHVLDMALGVPAARMPIELDVFITGQGWMQVGRGFTNDDGRVSDFGESPSEGIYRLVFDVAAYQPDAFFPSIAITFDVQDAKEHYHVPLLLSPFGYSAYRGS